MFVINNICMREVFVAKRLNVKVTGAVADY